MGGIGVNVNTPQEELDEIERPVWPATSLRALTGVDEDIVELRRQLVWRFASELQTYFAGGFAIFRERVNSLEVLLGARVCFRVHKRQEPEEGIFEGVSDDGLIQLRRAGGDLRTYPSGE